jgi:hypothetical protein
MTMLLPNHLGGVFEIFLERLFVELSQESMRFDERLLTIFIAESGFSCF